MTTQEIIAKVDALVDTYHSADHPLPDLLRLRKELAVWSYYLAAQVKQVNGNASLGYARRKYRIAEHIVDARATDAKASMNFLEATAMKLPTVMRAIEEEAWAEAEKECLAARMKAVGHVLQSMQQEISDMRSEKTNPNHQSEGA